MAAAFLTARAASAAAARDPGVLASPVVGSDQSECRDADLGTRSTLWRSTLEWWPCHPASTTTARATLRSRLATLPQATETPHQAGDHPHEHHHHHILIEPEEDRWRWRRKIREDKRKLAVYRVAVGLLGLILVALGFVSGPIPGPGGIPLILLGLAVWSSEFEWAHQVMMWFKKELHRYRTWSTTKKILVLGGLLRRLWTYRISVLAADRPTDLAARICRHASAAAAWALTGVRIGRARAFRSRCIRCNASTGAQQRTARASFQPRPECTMSP